MKWKTDKAKVGGNREGRREERDVSEIEGDKDLIIFKFSFISAIFPMHCIAFQQ